MALFGVQTAEKVHLNNSAVSFSRNDDSHSEHFDIGTVFFLPNLTNTVHEQVHASFSPMVLLVGLDRVTGS